MKITKEDLIEDINIRYLQANKDFYFSVDDVKKYYPKKKIEGTNVFNLDFEGEKIPMVKFEDIEDMTDFDLMIMKTMKFNHKSNDKK